MNNDFEYTMALASRTLKLDYFQDLNVTQNGLRKSLLCGILLELHLKYCKSITTVELQSADELIWFYNHGLGEVTDTEKQSMLCNFITSFPKLSTFKITERNYFDRLDIFQLQYLHLPKSSNMVDCRDTLRQPDNLHLTGLSFSVDYTHEYILTYILTRMKKLNHLYLDIGNITTHHDGIRVTPEMQNTINSLESPTSGIKVYYL